MLKAEKNLILWVERNMLWLLVLLAAAVGLYLRKMAIWWNSPDVNSYFDGHENNVQSMFYHLLVYLIQYLPLLPLHSVKWIVGITDYVVAILCLVAVGGYRKRLKIKSAFYLVVCILSPVVFLRGVCWGQVDALAFAFLLGAFILWEKGRKAGATALAVFGTAMYPAYIMIILGWMLCRKEKRQEKDWIYFGILAVSCSLVQIISGLTLGYTWSDSVNSCIYWTTYDPCLGTTYQEPLAWVKQMVNLFGYGIAMVGGIAAYRHKISYKAVLAIHLIVLLVYGSLIFPVVEVF